MNLIRLCVRRPVGVSVGVLLVVLFGVLALFNIPIQLTPDVDTTVLTVTTRWPGANPQEVEREIVDRQEEMLQSVKGVREMTSQSGNNQATITLEFYPEVSREIALRDVSDKLRQVSGYPIEVDEPTVEAADADIGATIAWLILYSEDASRSEEVRVLRDFAEDYIKPYLDRVPGVASVDVYGGLEREMQVRVDPAALAGRGLTFTQVMEALRRQNANISAGQRTQGKRDLTVRTIGEYESPEEILDTVIAYTAGGPVYIRDVAEVELSYKRSTGFVRSKGQFVLAFPVRRETGTNVMTVMAGVRDAIDRVNREVLQKRGLRLDLTQVYDETVYIDQSIAMVQNNIVYGGVLAIIVLMLFLRNWRATAIVALSIPIAVIGTFLVVASMGRTINVISLAGMAFAVGMVVDNAIVVLENIFRHRQMGKDAIRAALDGAGEVWGAVLASTLTTMAVFIPVIFVSEEAGQLFRDISIATAAAVALSLAVSMTVIPPLAARLLSGKKAAKLKTDEESTGLVAGFFSGVTDFVNRQPVLRGMVIVGMTVASLGLVAFLIPATTYLPAGNRNLVFGFLLTPPGYSQDEYLRMADVIEAYISPYWKVEPGSPEKAELDRAWVEMVQARIDAGAIPELAPGGAQGLSALERDRIRREWLTPPPCIENFFYVSFNGACFMGASSADPARVKPLVKLLSAGGQRIPGVYAIFMQTSLFRFGGGNNAEVQVRGNRMEDVVQAASAMYMRCARTFGFGEAQPNPSNFNLGRPELQVTPDRERAADLGLTVVDVGLVVEACVDGAYVGDYRVGGGDTIDITLYSKDGEAETIGERQVDIAAVPIYTPSGAIVPLSAAVNMVNTTALEQINHSERQRAVTITVNAPEAMALEDVIASINQFEKELRADGTISDDILISMTGNADKLQAARNTMVGTWTGFNVESVLNIVSSRFFLSVLIVYLLMAALFESWLYPFIIMFSVPLAVFGGFLGLRLANIGTLMTTDQPIQQLDVLTFLGFVILVGVVVNNAILLVHQSLHNMREAGMPSNKAIREAVRVRVRPVFMTSLTTIFGQLPLALVPGAGSELYRGLAAVMLGGLLIATLGTLILVPAVMGLLMDARAAFARALGREPDLKLAADPE